MRIGRERQLQNNAGVKPGRPAQTTDALSRATTVAYTPADGGSLTQVVTTNPKSQTSTVNTEAGRGETTSAIDVAGHRTDATYDELGRVTAVWLPGNPIGDLRGASTKYSYNCTTSVTSLQP